MTTYEIEGTFLVRCDTAANWARTDLEKKGANRILKKGEMGWVIGTSDFKIGDGVHTWAELQYIKPTPDYSPYALRLGEGENYYTYQRLKDIIASIEGDPELAEKVYTLQDQMVDVQTELTNLKNFKTKYYATREDFPGIGIQGPLYVDKSKDEIYYFNVDKYQDQGVGFIKLNSFDILQAELSV